MSGAVAVLDAADARAEALSANLWIDMYGVSNLSDNMYAVRNLSINMFDVSKFK